MKPKQNLEGVDKEIKAKIPYQKDLKERAERMEQILTMQVGK